MLQFIQGSEAAFADLERRAQQACIVFPNQQMPPDTRPATARIGFEISRSGEALLFVDRGLRYPGSNAEVQEWIHSGTKRFANFTLLKRWIQSELASAYGSEPPALPTGLLAYNINTGRNAPDRYCASRTRRGGRGHSDRTRSRNRPARRSLW